jgi:two-component system, OmpR family, sensor kinase
MNLRIWPSRLRRTQLRTRVLAGVLAVTLAALASFGYAAVTALHQYLLANTDASLKTVLARYESVTDQVTQKSDQGSSKYGSGSGSGPRPGASIPAFLDQYCVQFETSQGQLQELMGGDAELVPLLPSDLTTLAARHGTQTVMSSSGNTQLLLMAASGPGGTLIVTTSLESVSSIMSRLTVIVIVGTLAAGLVVFAGAGLVIRRGLRPVQAMAATADKITAGDLTIRVNAGEPETEVGHLADALNGMLARIQTAVDEREASEQAVRQFFADTSHELRSPLASLRANAELYQQGALSRRAQVDEAMRRITSEARRMGTLVDDMLRLARIDQHPSQERKPVDLTALITECADRARIASPDRTWHICIAPGLATTGEEEMLHRAIDNLLANIITHTLPGTTATILGTASEGTITIKVSDDGPGVDAGQLPRIFDRFYRAPAQMSTPGSGLGLAIVAAIATAHHGTVEAALNSPRGLRVTLTLPKRDLLSV